jgi:hypothetical protein
MQRTTKALVYLANHPGQPFCWPCLNRLGSKDIVQETKDAPQAANVPFGEMEGLCSHCNRYTLIAQA